ncbi:hypothetical protein G7046_g4074 [Stylonectria norvegica]|nr:hypothetical protein G7046_g4074 [Stylonectria norvegica]
MPRDPRHPHGHRHHSSRSHHPQDAEIPLDPNLFFSSDSHSVPPAVDPYAAGAGAQWQGNSQQAYYQDQNAANYNTTIDPANLMYDNAASSSMAQDIVSSAYQNQAYAQPPSPPATTSNNFACNWNGCYKTFATNRDLRKHTKQHEKPISCQAEPTCDVRKAEQRDMDRHYRNEHRAWAREHGISTDDSVCEVCGQTCTRPDNLRKHMRNKHGVNP